MREALHLGHSPAPALLLCGNDRPRAADEDKTFAIRGYRCLCLPEPVHIVLRLQRPASASLTPKLSAYL